jgi:hypothetical protein
MGEERDADIDSRTRETHHSGHLATTKLMTNTGQRGQDNTALQIKGQIPTRRYQDLANSLYRSAK